MIKMASDGGSSGSASGRLFGFTLHSVVIGSTHTHTRCVDNKSPSIPPMMINSNSSACVCARKTSYERKRGQRSKDNLYVCLFSYKRTVILAAAAGFGSSLDKPSMVVKWHKSGDDRAKDGNVRFGDPKWIG